MATKNALDGLIKLSAKEAEVIYYKCEPLSHADIAEKLGKEESTVNEQSSSAIRKLGIDTKNLSSDQIILSLTEYYEALQEYVKNPNQDFKTKQSWLVIIRRMNKDLAPVGEPEPEKPEETEQIGEEVEEIGEEVTEGETSGEVSFHITQPGDDENGNGDEEPEEPREPEEDDGRRNLWIGITIGVAVICLVCASVGYLQRSPIIGGIINILSRLDTPPEESVAALLTSSPTEPPLPQFTITLTSPLTLTPTERSAPAEKFTPTVTPTSTTNPTYTSTPTDTPSPTVTETPIITPTSPSRVVIDEDFSEGVPGDWNVTQGEVTVVNGELVSIQNAHVYIGNPQWQNYMIEFDIVNAPRGFSHAGLRLESVGNYVSFSYNHSQGRWYRNLDGVESEIPNARADLNLVGVRVRVKVEGNEYLAEIGSVLISSHIDDHFDRGSIIMRLFRETTIDNFKVTLLP